MIDPSPIVRPLIAADRSAVRALLQSSPNFTEDETVVAVELVDEYLERGEESGYLLFVVHAPTESPSLPGYVCIGPTPLTDGTYDLYWIAVHDAAQGRGYGRLLLRFAEDEVRRRGGRLLLIETSSQEGYAGTLRFYERSGYTLEARIRDFYRAEDDKLIFAKRIE